MSNNGVIDAKSNLSNYTSNQIQHINNMEAELTPKRESTVTLQYTLTTKHDFFEAHMMKMEVRINVLVKPIKTESTP